MSKTVFYNAKIYVEKGDYREALYQKDGRIILVGTNEEVLRAAGEDAEKIDCGGRTMVPGFNDSHMHVSFLGVRMILPDIKGCQSVEELVAVCEKYLAENPDIQKIDLEGWNEDNFEHGEHRAPTKYDLDKVSTTVPIKLTRICGHAAAVNSKMLEMMGIDRDHHEVPGGKIALDENGEPTGVIYESACAFATSFLPDVTVEDVCKGFKKGVQYAVEHGLTSCQSNDLLSNVKSAETYYAGIRQAYEEGGINFRWHAQVGAETLEGVKRYVEGPHYHESLFDDHFNLGGLKMLKDGSLGARSAYMREEYQDDPGNHGVLVVSDEVQKQMVDYAEAHDLQVVTHVIGTGAIMNTAEAYVSAMNGRPNRNRHTLIHCQITDREMLKYIRDNDLLVSAQPVFLEYDLHAVDSRVGVKMGSTSYATKTADDLGIHISYGTDCPVEDCNPMCNLYCAVLRKDYKGFPENGWNPQECVDIETAVDHYTLGSAYQEFRENVKGRLKSGFYADLVVLDQDIFTIDPHKLLEVKPVLTMVGGEIAYRNNL